MTDGSPFWQAVFMDENGVERQRSTRDAGPQEGRGDPGKPRCGGVSDALAEQLRRRVCRVMSEVAALVGGDTSGDVTYAEYSRGFLARSAAMELHTHSNRRSALQSVVAYLAADINLPLGEITKRHIVGYRDAALEAGAAPGTVRNRVEVLHTMFEEAVRVVPPSTTRRPGCR